jgi:hypothetical protein
MPQGCFVKFYWTPLNTLPSDLFQLQLTCRVWGNVAQDITSTNKDLDLMKFIATIMNLRLKSNKDLGKLGRAVDFTKSYSDTVLAASLRLLGLLCPNIQAILVKRADTVFYKSLSQVVDTGILKSLQLCLFLLLTRA